MTCNIKYFNPIFTIEKINRNKNREYYIFIGTISEEINNIILKIENRRNIKTNEVRILKNNYPIEYKEWIKIAKDDKNTIIKFIKNKINIDDSIRELKNKIFIFLSDLSKKKFIIPENQEIWVNYNNKYEIIGHYYNNIKDNKNEKLFNIPHLFENFDQSLIYSKDLSNSNIKINTSENNMLLIDLIIDFKLINNTIYVSDAKDEELYLKNNKININDSIINNYFKKYWPYINLFQDNTPLADEIKNNYILMNENYKKENYIYDLINNIPISPNLFGSCNIINMKIEVNKQHKNIIDNYYSSFVIENNENNEANLINLNNNINVNNSNDINNVSNNNNDLNKNKVNNKDNLNNNNLNNNNLNNNNLNNNYNINSILKNEDDKIVDINLYKIFNYIREKKIDQKTPYIKYSENFLEAPFSIISREAIDKNIITKDNLKIWVGIEEQRKTNGIIIKRYLKDYNNSPRYSSLFLNKTGQIEINISFKDEYNANFSDIEYAVKDCKKFIEDINRNRLSKNIDSSIQINPPYFNAKDKNIIM
jgi:hypothetical protein